jgi:hypothetical protein
LLEIPELLKLLYGKKKKKGFKFADVGEAKTSLHEEGLTIPQIDILEEHAFIHEEDVCIEEYEIIVYETTSKLSDEIMELM